MILSSRLHPGSASWWHAFVGGWLSACFRTKLATVRRAAAVATRFGPLRSTNLRLSRSRLLLHGMAGLAVIAYGGYGFFSGILGGSLVHAAGVSPLYAATAAIGWPVWAEPLYLVGLASFLAYLYFGVKVMCPKACGPAANSLSIEYCREFAACGLVVGWLLGALAADRWGWAFPAAFGAVALTCTARCCPMLPFETCQGCWEGACQGCMHAKEWYKSKTTRSYTRYLPSGATTVVLL
jgi:hypothetical protein